MKKKIKVVLDTNILVSALWSANGNEATIVKLIPHAIIPCFSREMFDEYSEVLNRPKFNFSANNKKLLLSKIIEYGKLVLPEQSNIHMIDETDRTFYDTAKTSGAILITGNMKHYPIEPFIMTAREFLERS